MLVLILRSAHVEDVRQTSNARARVSKDEGRASVPSCFETHRSATMLGRRRPRSRCDAPQHEGRGRTAHLAKRSQWGACLLAPCETDLRLQEAIAGADPLFPACCLQRMVQLERESGA